MAIGPDEPAQGPSPSSASQASWNIQNRSMRTALLALFALSLATGAGFIIAIVANLGSGIILHEVGGAVLLILLLLALWPATRLAPVDRRPRHRVEIALAGLIAAVVTGASLASGALSSVVAGLPLIPLGVMLVSIADGLRLTRAVLS